MDRLMKELAKARATLVNEQKGAEWIFSCCKTSKEWEEGHTATRNNVESAKRDVEFLEYLIRKTEGAMDREMDLTARKKRIQA